MRGGTAVGKLDWLLANLAATCAGINCAVVLSPDGLPLGRSPGLSEADSGHLAALAAGVQSLGYGLGQQLDFGEVTQTIVQMTGALLFIQPAGQGTCLALLAQAGADAGQIAYETAVLVKRVGQYMIADRRLPVPGPVTG
jgi:predicted regulator of Ras-like GTPase activity (Roadblock/LC7/MglB family)